MIRVDLHKSIVLYLTWLGTLAGALIVALADILPFRLTFVRPDNLFVCLTECQVFFVLFIWPLFIPALTRAEGEAEPGAGAVRLLFLQVAVLVVFALPLVLICSNVSNADVLTLVRGEALVVALAAFVASLFALGRERGWRVGSWYYLAVLVASAGLPFLAYLGREFGRAAVEAGHVARKPVDLEFLSTVSPFWGALEVDGGNSLVQAAFFGAAALGLALVGPFLRRGMDAPAPAK